MESFEDEAQDEGTGALQDGEPSVVPEFDYNLMPNEYLQNILRNAAKHSNLLANWVKYENCPVEEQERLLEDEGIQIPRKKTALRIAYTLRDSLSQVADLVAGRAPAKFYKVHPDTQHEFLSLREAEIYKNIKSIQKHLRVDYMLTQDRPDQVHQMFESILEYIREGEESNADQ